jgi:ubiquinone/menaquinone biosynthesis C-methylase UbiE
VISLLDLADNPSLLEIACGTGWALRYAAGLAGTRAKFYGVDPSSKMIEQASKRSAPHKNIHFARASAQKLPFHDQSLEFVICANAFHHFPNPTSVIAESTRVLKSGGKVYIADATDDMLIVTIIDKLQKRLQPAHVKTYSTREYQAFFQAAGLSYVTHKTILPALKIHIGEKR